MSETKTNTQRSEEFRQRRTARGLREVRGAWAHPDDHRKLKEYALQLMAKRERAGAM